mgnify:CR=1 FL=1
MKVEAIRLGYYGDKRRKEGDTFYLKDEKHFSKLWMKKFEENEDQPRHSKNNKKAKPIDLNEEVI